MRVDSQELPFCNLSLSAASMSSWVSQAHAFHQTAPFERFTCPYHQNLLSWRMRPRSSMSSPHKYLIGPGGDNVLLEYLMEKVLTSVIQHYVHYKAPVQWTLWLCGIYPFHDNAPVLLTLVVWDLSIS